MNNFNIPVVDTDSIMICKPNEEEFTQQEIEKLTKELNSLYPDGIYWEFESEYKTVIVAKAKNYILFDGKKKTIKGSAFKSSSKEPALKDFCNEIIDAIIEGKDNYTEIYEKYVAEIANIQDIKRWCSKKTVSEKVLKSDRTNEKKIREALDGMEFSEGDKVYVYFKQDDSLGIAENFDGNYNQVKLLEKLYKSTKIFDSVLPTKDLFRNYKLVKNYLIFKEKYGNIQQLSLM